MMAIDAFVNAAHAPRALIPFGMPAEGSGALVSFVIVAINVFSNAFR